jgi:hypothetical protein
MQNAKNSLVFIALNFRWTAKMFCYSKITQSEQKGTIRNESEIKETSSLDILLLNFVAKAPCGAAARSR